MRISFAAVIACSLAFFIPHLAAAELPQPTGDIVLTVSGNIATTNADGTAVFDQAMLDGMLQRSTKATTPWYTGEQTFSGVVVSDLLDVLGASGTSATVIALNDYSAEIPLEEFRDMPIILASRVGGQTLSVRDKGPLMVIYPFDLDPSLSNELVFGRSVWQVSSIQIH